MITALLLLSAFAYAAPGAQYLVLSAVGLAAAHFGLSLVVHREAPIRPLAGLIVLLLLIESAQNGLASLAPLAGWLTFLACGYWFIVCKKSADVHAGARLLYVLGPAAACSAALTSYALVPSIAQAVSQTGQVRLTGGILQLHPNTLAYIAVILSIGTYHLVATARHRWVLYALSLATLSLTQSRSAMLALLVAALSISWIRRRLQVRLLALAAGGGAVLLSAAGAVLDFLARGQSAETVLALSGRQAIWSEVVRNYNPDVHGGGFGVAPGAAVAETGLYLAYEVSTTDNVYLDLVLAAGLPVLLLSLCLHSVLLLKLMRTLRALRTLRTANEWTPDHAALSASVLVLIVLLLSTWTSATLLAAGALTLIAGAAAGTLRRAEMESASRLRATSPLATQHG